VYAMHSVLPQHFQMWPSVYALNITHNKDKLCTKTITPGKKALTCKHQTLHLLQHMAANLPQAVVRSTHGGGNTATMHMQQQQPASNCLTCPCSNTLTTCTSTEAQLALQRYTGSVAPQHNLHTR
jgi:hypothetical protein